MKIHQPSVKNKSRSLAAPTSPAGDAPAAIVGTTLSRQELIAIDAYFHAEKRGFVPGFELDDWLAAEHAVDQRLRETSTIRG